MKLDAKRRQLEVLFVQGMEEIMKEGLDFNSLVHEVLKELLGERASREFFASTSTYFPAPEAFAEVAKRAFPERTLALIFNMVVNRAYVWVTTSKYAGTSLFQTLMRELHSQLGTAPAERKLNPLHDHRAEDELDKLVGHRTT